MSVHDDIQTLNKTIILWTYLRDNPLVTKIQAYSDLDLEKDISDCPLCDNAAFGSAIRGVNCKLCLLRDIWPLRPVSSSPMCCRDGSPYQEWMQGKPGTADKIIEATQRKLNEIRRLLS